MGHIRSGLLAAAVGIAVLAPQAASANVITETYTMTQVPAVSADGLSLFPESPVAEFNPADGTLTSVAESLNSPVTMSVFDQGISGATMTSIAVSPSMAKMTATASVESD